MPAITSTAPGKIILFGEHAVVYGQPAIAVPVRQVKARTVASADPLAPSGDIRLVAPDINLDAKISELEPDFPLSYAVLIVLEEIGIDQAPACTLRMSSTIPIASGLGSGTAVSVSLIRAFSEFLGYPLTDRRVNELAYEVDILYHGTPSGIDNTVITYSKGIFFQHGEPMEFLAVPVPITVVIADTGISSPTAATVGDVRKAWMASQAAYDQIFDRIGCISIKSRELIETGQIEDLGPLMDENHSLLQDLNVSSLNLDRLAKAAIDAGAIGAKMSGGGRGGNLIALATSDSAGRVSEALMQNGAVRTIITTVQENT